MLNDFFTWALDAAHSGVGFWPYAHWLINVLLGTFFLCSGLNKTFHQARHDEFCETLRRCGIPCVPIMRYVVSVSLIVLGAMLIIGWYAPFAAASLIIICFVAICTDGWFRIDTLPPGRVVNRVDYVAWQLYLVEVWYVLALLVPLTQGAPWFSLQILIGG